MNKKWTSDWTRNSQDELAVADGCWFDKAAGERICEFFPTYLCHYEGKFAGKQFDLLPWQEDLIMRLYGWKRESGLRRFRAATIWIPKKNGKTAFATGLVFIGLIADGEPGAKVFSAATSREQAAIVYGNAEKMINSSEALQSYLRTLPSKKKIFLDKTDSEYTAISADSGVNEGLNASQIIKDELHAWSTGPGQRLYATLKYAGRMRTQPLDIEISTAGEDLEGIGYARYSFAKQIKNGDVPNWTILPIIYEAEKGDDPGDEEVWAKANPSLDIIIDREEMRTDWQNAQNNPIEENWFLRYLLNIWVTAKARWIKPEQWEVCQGSDLTPEDLIGRPCCGGLDLALVDDSTAWVLCFPLEDHKFAILPHFFLPEEGIVAKEAQDGVPYRRWAEEGWYTLTPGDVTDFAFIKHRIIEDWEKYDLREAAYDPYKGDTLAQELVNEHGLEMVAHRQGYLSMSEPCQQFQRLVQCADLEHFGNPVMKWMAANAIVTMDPAGNIKLDKAASRKKIDGVVGAVMAFSRSRIMPAVATSIYSTTSDVSV